MNELSEMMRLLRYVIFPEYSDVPSWTDGRKAIREILSTQISTLEGTSGKEADIFVDSIDEIGRLLHTDVEAVAHNDPAVTDIGEVILCYPAVEVMLHYRSAHLLYKLGVKHIPRMLTEMAHSSTGIDIHPAAEIGEYFAIDHGTGIVIGATTIIGNRCMLYQGVTLGAKNFSYGADGRPVDKPRHPILEDNVTVYSNTSILGRITIGHDSVIGGNLWLTQDVPPYSRVLQARPVNYFDNNEQK